MLLNMKLINKETYEMVDTDFVVEDNLSFRKFKSQVMKELDRIEKRLLTEDNLRRLHKQKQKEE